MMSHSDPWHCIPSDSDSGLDESLIEVVGMCAPHDNGSEVEFAVHIVGCTSAGN
jgi:hypothetical protein